MALLLAAVLTVHGLIHLIFLRRQTGIRRAVWALAFLLFVAAAVMAAVHAGAWWIAAGAGVVVSQSVIVRRWKEAKFGTPLNIAVTAAVFIGWSAASPAFIAEYRTEVSRHLSVAPETDIVTMDDIAHLPPPVRRYLAFSGSLGRPKVRNVRVVSSGTMRRTLDADWMAISAQQYDFFDVPARIFLIRSSLFDIPFDGLHVLSGDTASMRIRAASLMTVADARGETMNRSETVTFFNDMCVLAPATLIDRNILWISIDDTTAGAVFTKGRYSITATLSFDRQGALVDFSSDDRSLSETGASYERHRWTTPVGAYREIGGRRVATAGEAIWHLPTGRFPYARFTFDSIEYNVRDAR